eukprot:SAG31_NODE_848_length_11534_cov_8.897463_6_plen_133_part_00
MRRTARARRGAARRAGGDEPPRGSAAQRQMQLTLDPPDWGTAGTTAALAVLLAAVAVLGIRLRRLERLLDASGRSLAQGKAQAEQPFESCLAVAAPTTSADDVQCVYKCAAAGGGHLRQGCRDHSAPCYDSV